jgi:hypothetical protein
MTYHDRTSPLWDSFAWLSFASILRRLDSLPGWAIYQPGADAGAVMHAPWKEPAAVRDASCLLPALMKLVRRHR